MKTQHRIFNTTLTRPIELTVLECPMCGAIFAVLNDFDDHRRQDEKTFYCPTGHSLSYGESELKKRARMLEEQQRRLLRQVADQDQQLELRKRQIAARKGQVTKLRTAAKQGQCPCCGKVFAHLERHMATAHPDFTTEPEDV